MTFYDGIQDYAQLRAMSRTFFLHQTSLPRVHLSFAIEIRWREIWQMMKCVVVNSDHSRVYVSSTPSVSCLTLGFVWFRAKSPRYFSAMGCFVSGRLGNREMPELLT